MKHDGKLSDPFPLNRGVKQGSVLSPKLFLIVLDTLLKNIDKQGHELSLSSLNVGSSGHADDIRTACNSIEAVLSQVTAITSFTDSNSLKLNPSKTGNLEAFHFCYQYHNPRH